MPAVAIAFTLIAPAIAQEQVTRRCEVQEYPGECTIRSSGRDMHIGFYQNGEYREGYRWTWISDGKFKDEAGIVWKASGDRLSTRYTSWQCPPRMSCQEFLIQIWH
jgi:hypothetical protein